LGPSVVVFSVPVVLFLIFWALCDRPLSGFVKLAKAGGKLGGAWLARSRLGKWAIAHPRSLASYAPVLLVVALGGLAALGAGTLFVDLAEQFRITTSRVYRYDQTINAWVGHERRDAVTTLLRGATILGGSTGMGILVAIVAAILLIRKERASAIFVLVTAVGGAILNTGLKMIFARARPDMATAIAVARFYSFPSGHAMISFITCGALAYIALRQPWSWALKSAALAVALTIVVLVGVSRVYLGVHWTSDIAGGWSAGIVWLAAAVVAFEMLLRLRQRKRGAAPSPPTADVPDKPVPPKPATT
jgi:membrane-associated phospholipid phosphatase